MRADALDAEWWASIIIGSLQERAPAGRHVGEVLPGLWQALEELGTPGALAALRAFGAVCVAPHAKRARDAADRLAADGVAEPPWAEAVGTARPTQAALMYDETFDGGEVVIVEFAAANMRTHAICVYIDHQLGGIVKHVGVVGSLGQARAEHERGRWNGKAAMRDLELADVRARLEGALRAVDRTASRWVSADLESMRALVEARVRLLPRGPRTPDRGVERAVRG
jgi:hypothetical protein